MHTRVDFVTAKKRQANRIGINFIRRTVILLNAIYIHNIVLHEYVLYTQHSTAHRA